MPRTRSLPLEDVKATDSSIYTRLSADLFVDPQGKVLKMIPQQWGKPGKWEDTGKRVTRSLLNKITGRTDDTHQGSDNGSVGTHSDAVVQQAGSNTRPDNMAQPVS